jgi:hypothetical protein
VIESAKRIAASGTRPARLSVSGRFDTGPAGLELPAAAELRVGDVSFDLSGVPGPRGSTRYEQDGLRLDLTPARSGSSAVSLRLTVEGDAADAVDPEGEVVLFLGLGEFEGLGSATLQGGAFSATKGVGSRTTPSMTLRSFKAKLGVAGRHSFAVKGAFRPYDAVPGAAPSVRVEIGGHFSITLDGAEFTERKGKFVLKAKGPPDWNVTVDPLKGTLALKGARLNIGEFPPGAAPVRLVLVVGDRRFEDEPVLVATESALSY